MLEAATELLSQLVAINSINSDLVSGGPGEADIAAFVARWLSDHGISTHLEDAAPGRPNVIGVLRGSGGGKSLMLNAHMDTVGVEGMERPHAPYVENGTLYGRGSYDMKGGLAACMLALAKLTDHPLRGDVILTAVADEEYASIGTSAMLKNWHADAAIVTEPTDLNVCIAHKGFVWLDIKTRGVAAHGSRPDLGVDAIVQMGHVLVGLDRLNRQLLSSPPHRLLNTGSLHASLIAGGQGLSSYPERCLLQVERRTIPGERPAQVEAQIQRVLDDISASDPAFTAAVSTALVRDSFEIAESAPIVGLLSEKITAARGQRPALFGQSFWMDTALIAAAGIPVAAFGTGGAGAHAVIEWVPLQDVVTCADVLIKTAADWCA